MLGEKFGLIGAAFKCVWAEPGVKTTISSVISVYDILKADKLLVDKEAALKIQEVYAK